MKGIRFHISRISSAVLRPWRSLTSGLSPYVEKRQSEAEVMKLMQQASIPSFGFFFMLGLATAIASFGMLSNSAPAIIGAMIIAPLMAPIMSLAFGMVHFDSALISRSFFSVACGGLLVVALAYATTLVFGLRIAGSEILSRTSPTLLDLGIAVAAGAAAAFSYTRQSITTSIAGVAIAVALVPPLTVSGIGLALGRDASAEVGLSMTELGLYSGGSDIARGSFVLFLTNLVGIVAVGTAVFALQRYGQWKKAIVGLVLTTTLSMLLIEPLDQALRELYAKSTALRLIASMRSIAPDGFGAQAKIDTLNVTYRSGEVYVYMDAIAPRETTQNLQAQIDGFRAILAAILEEPVHVELEVVPVDLLRLTSRPNATAGDAPSASTAPGFGHTE